MEYYKLNINDITEKDEEYIKNNYPIRYQKASKFFHRADFLRSIGAYLLLEKAFGEFSEKDIEYSENGKPSLKNNPFFNYSHSGNYIVLAESDKPIGIDVQIIDGRQKFFVKEWTRKEAILKLMDEPIRLNLDDIKVKNDDTSYKGKEIYLETEAIDDRHIVSIASLK